MTITGNFAALARMRERMAELATVPSRVSRAAAGRLGELIQDEFDRGEDPYESPWAPLAPATEETGRIAPPLTDTSAMRDSLRVRPLAGAGVGITIAHPAGPHQTGWTGRQGSGPARPILPAGDELPDAWAEALEQEAEKAFRKATE